MFHSELQTTVALLIAKNSVCLSMFCVVHGACSFVIVMRFKLSNCGRVSACFVFTFDMAVPVAPAFARSFLALLKENDVGPQVQTYLLRVGCLTVQQMYGRCDDVTEIQANIIAGAIPNPDDSSATLELQLLEKSKLKHVWLQCEALVKHELEKLATGRTDDELDDAPLSRDDYLMVTGAFKAKYDWSLPARRMVGDGTASWGRSGGSSKKMRCLSWSSTAPRVWQTRTGARNPRGKGSGPALRTVPTWNG